MAVGFTALVNLLLAASLVWTAWFDLTVLLGGWLVVLALWSASALISMKTFEWSLPGVLVAPPDVRDDLYANAQDQYLQGNWFETERLLNQQLEQNSKDVDARLMRATLRRHMGRLEAALADLDALERFDASEKWREEIRAERVAIAGGQAAMVAEAESS